MLRIWLLFPAPSRRLTTPSALGTHMEATLICSENKIVCSPSNSLTSYGTKATDLQPLKVKATDVLAALAYRKPKVKEDGLKGNPSYIRDPVSKQYEHFSCVRAQTLDLVRGGQLLCH